MPEPVAGITTTELIRAAADQGYTISENNLWRWRASGLLKQPERSGLGRGRGRAACVYPEETVPQLLALLRIREEDNQRKRKSQTDDWGWRLWAEGYDVVDFVRQSMVAHFDKEEARLKATLRKVQADDESLDEPDEGGVPHLRLPRELDAVRRRVGPDLFPTVVRLFAELLLGGFKGDWFSPGDNDHTILASVWTNPRDRAAMEQDPDEMVPFLQTMGDVFNIRDLRNAAASASEEDLVQVREEVRAFAAHAFPGGRIRPEAFIGWFAVRKGSEPIAEFINHFLTDPSIAEQREQVWASLRRKK